MKKTLFAVLLLMGCFAFAEDNLMVPEFWSKKTKAQFKDGKILVTGKTELLADKAFKIEAGKNYHFTADVKKVAGDSASTIVHFALRLEDKNGRVILYHFAKAIAGTDTVLVKPLKKGDTTLTVKDASKWTKNGRYVQYNVKPNLADLPNRNTFPIEVQSIEKKASDWTVTLAKPVKVSIPAGIAVRQAPSGGFFILLSSKVTTKSLHIASRPAGTTPAEKGVKKEQFYSGAISARVQILANWKSNADKDTVEISNLKLIAE